MPVRARHLSLSVPWHDAAWNGTVGQDPAANCHCIELTNIAKYRSVKGRDGTEGAGVRFDVNSDDLPPCSDESGGFLSPTDWRISHQHPYKKWAALADTHGHLEDTEWTVPSYSAHAVPFRWMSRRELEEFVQQQLRDPLPPDDPPRVYTSDWVFWPQVQDRILDGFFAPIQDDKSFAIFYTKTRQPIFDDVTRLVVGIGLINRVASTLYYGSSDPSKPAHPIWQREISHSPPSRRARRAARPFPRLPRPHRDTPYADLWLPGEVALGSVPHLSDDLPKRIEFLPSITIHRTKPDVPADDVRSNVGELNSPTWSRLAALAMMHG